MNTVGLGKTLNRNPKLISQIFFSTSTMGTTITVAEIGADEKKSDDLSNKQQMLINDLHQKKLIDGDVIFESNILASIGDNQNQLHFRLILMSIFNKVTHLGFSYTYGVIAGQLQELLEGARKFAFPSFGQRAYPIMTNHGFAIAYFRYHIQKVTIKKNNIATSKLILISAIKVIRPTIPPKTWEQFSTAIVFTAIQQKDRKPILKAIWDDIQTEWTIEFIQNEVSRLKQAYSMELMFDD